jgi:hypothetical protein
MSDNQKTIEFLQRFNQWRRGDESIEQPDPTEIGVAIDDAIKCIGQLDTMADALGMIATHNHADGQCDNGYSPQHIAAQALAAVKGGSHE